MCIIPELPFLAPIGGCAGVLSDKVRPSVGLYRVAHFYLHGLLTLGFRHHSIKPQFFEFVTFCAIATILTYTTPSRINVCYIFPQPPRSRYKNWSTRLILALE